MKLELLEIYIQELAALRDAEQQTISATPRITQAISRSDAREAMQEHLQVTKEQVRRLEEMLARLGGANEKRSEATRGLLAEMQEMSKGSKDPLQEVGWIMTAKKMEALEIACYSGALDLARQLGMHQDVKLLERTLSEERNMADRLTALGASVMLEAAEIEDARAAG